MNIGCAGEICFFFLVLMRLPRKYEQCVSSEHTIQSDIANKRKLLCYCMWVLESEKKKKKKMPGSDDNADDDKVL